MRGRPGRLGAWLLPAALAAALLVAGGWQYLRLSIDRAADEVAAAARESYPGDRVEALIRVATSEDEPLPRRNEAIWALGQLRDDRALPHLEALHVQQECDHGRLVCQHEVRKALATIRGERTPAHALKTAWRHLRERLGLAPEPPPETPPTELADG